MKEKPFIWLYFNSKKFGQSKYFFVNFIHFWFWLSLKYN